MQMPDCIAVLELCGVWSFEDCHLQLDFSLFV